MGSGSGSVNSGSQHPNLSLAVASTFLVSSSSRSRIASLSFSILVSNREVQWQKLSWRWSLAASRASGPTEGKFQSSTEVLSWYNHYSAFWHISQFFLACAACWRVRFNFALSDRYSGRDLSAVSALSFNLLMALSAPA